MKKFYPILLAFLLVAGQSARAARVVITDGTPYTMDNVWLGVCNTLGYTAAIYPSTILSTNTWFDTTDILIVSTSQTTLTNDQIDTIQSFLLQGGRVYMQAEYLNSFSTNIAFQQIVNATGGSFTWSANTTPGVLEPMSVLGALNNKPNSVDSLTYYWYGDSGSIGCNSHIEPFLEYQGAYYGFIYCVPSNNSRMITTSDQDWVQQSISIPLMENILINLASPTYTCVATSGSLNVNLGPNRSICNGQLTTLDATTAGAASYLWSTNATTSQITVSTIGTYWVQVSNGGCIASDTIFISNTTLNSTTLNPSVCPGTSYTLPGGRIVSIAGTYTDTLISSAGCDSVIVTQLAIPATVTSTVDTTICSGIHYTLPGGGIANTAGTYTDTVQSSTGCDSIVITNLSTLPGPTLNFLGNDTAYCGPFTRSLNAGNAAAIWSTGDTAAMITINTGGIYRASVSGTCGVVSDSIVISANPLPVINLGSNRVACGGQTVQLDAGNAGSNYAWSTGAQTETINVLSGTFSVTVTTLSACSASASVLVSADPLHDSLTIQNAYCNMNNGSIEVIAEAGLAPYLYAWSNGDTGTLATSLAAGNYSVTASDALGCSASSSASISAGSTPPLEINSSDTTICPGDTAELCASSGFASYQWSSGDTGLCIRTPYAGPYSVSAVYTSNCVATSGQVNVHQLTPAPVTVSVNGDTLTCYPESSYQWYRNDTLLPGDTTNQLIITQAGTYDVTVKTSSGCFATSSAIDVSNPGNPSGINAIMGASRIEVYPNPLSTGNWQLEVSENLVGAWCTVFDAAGQIIFKNQITNPESQLGFSAARGVYVLQVYSGQEIYNVKLIKME